MKTIIVNKRTSDFHVCLQGRTSLWGRGASITEAIGDMVLTSPESFNLKIQDPAKPRRKRR